jgi:arginine:ornithine antiporter/lysine permease
MFYASEPKYLAMVPMLLTLGLPLFFWARIHEGGMKNIFKGNEMKVFLSLIALDAFTGFLFINGTIKL